MYVTPSSDAGIRLIDSPSGAHVLLDNISDSPVFVQSRNANIKLNLQPTAVCRVPAHSSFMLFDYQLFTTVSKLRAEARVKSSPEFPYMHVSSQSPHADAREGEV